MRPLPPRLRHRLRLRHGRDPRAGTLTGCRRGRQQPAPRPARAGGARAGRRRGGAGPRRRRRRAPARRRQEPGVAHAARARGARARRARPGDARLPARPARLRLCGARVRAPAAARGAPPCSKGSWRARRARAPERARRDRGAHAAVAVTAARGPGGGLGGPHRARVLHGGRPRAARRPRRRGAACAARRRRARAPRAEHGRRRSTELERPRARRRAGAATRSPRRSWSRASPRSPRPCAASTGASSPPSTCPGRRSASRARLDEAGAEVARAADALVGGAALSACTGCSTGNLSCNVGRHEQTPRAPRAGPRHLRRGLPLRIRAARLPPGRAPSCPRSCSSTRSWSPSCTASSSTRALTSSRRSRTTPTARSCA